MSNNQRYYGGTGDPYSREGRGTGTSRFKIFLIIGLLMAGYQVFKYFSNTQKNEITGEEQKVQWTLDEEIALGLQSAPAMAQEYGGLHPDKEAQTFIDAIGKKLTTNTIASKTGYPFDFHVLADETTVNAFALPGGQCFITAGLLSRLKSEDQIAGVMGHEIGHVIHRHSAERMAKDGLISGLIQSVMVGSGGNASATQIANVVGSMTSMSYGRDQELESDEFGVQIMVQSGYNPEALIAVMDVLEQAGGGQRTPEFQSTHPSPENRKQRIKESIAKYKK